uniref:Uncharacterized protein n=1 Tax=Caenorhabditis japonica TaxID=281687 RepID=A0A8R1IZH2_CAEJA
MKPHRYTKRSSYGITYGPISEPIGSGDIRHLINYKTMGTSKHKLVSKSLRASSGVAIPITRLTGKDWKEMSAVCEPPIRIRNSLNLKLLGNLFRCQTKL